METTDSLRRDVEEALDAVCSNRVFDLFLADINLGAGEEEAKLFHILQNREDTATSRPLRSRPTPCPETARTCLREGFDEYVGKPFTGEELIEAIDQTLAAA